MYRTAATSEAKEKTMRYCVVPEDVETDQAYYCEAESVQDAVDKFVDNEAECEADDGDTYGVDMFTGYDVLVFCEDGGMRRMRVQAAVTVTEVEL